MSSGTKYKLNRYANTALKGGEHRVDRIGMFADEFRAWIAERLPPGETMKGFGKTWVLGRLVPAQAFDLEDEKEVRLFNHYQNLAPIALPLLRSTALSVGYGTGVLKKRGRKSKTAKELAKRLNDYLATIPEPKA